MKNLKIERAKERICRIVNKQEKENSRKAISINQKEKENGQKERMNKFKKKK